jgi:hypothetical protein
MQDTGQTGAMELVSDQPLPISVVPNQMVPTFPSTISNVGPHYSTTVKDQMATREGGVNRSR